MKIELKKTCSLVPLFVLSLGLLLSGCKSTADKARAELKTLGYEFTGDGFWKAIAEKDNKAMNLYFDAKIDPNVRKGNVPVFVIASATKNELAVKYLLNSGVDTNMKFDIPNFGKNVTVPILVAAFGTTEQLKTLADKGADLKSLDDEGKGIFGIVVNSERTENEKIKSLKILVKHGVKITLSHEGLRQLGATDKDEKTKERLALIAYTAAAEIAGNTKLKDYLGTLEEKGDRSVASVPEKNTGKDCETDKKIPEGSKTEVIEICKRACESKFGYGCFKLGLDLEEADAAGSIAAYKKGCELKESRACNFLVSRHPSIIPELKIDCDKNKNARSCALIAMSYGKNSKTGENLKDQLQYGAKSCKAGDGLGCLQVAMYYVSQMNPDDNASVQKYGKLGMPFAKKSCSMGWDSGCLLAR